MKKICGIISLLIALAGLAGCNGLGVHGSGIIKDEQRNITGFEKLDVSGFYNIRVICGKEPSLKIIGDDNIIPLIKTEIKGNTLHIWTKRNISLRKGIKIEIGAKNITSINSSGASKIFVSGINNNKMDIDASGAESIKLAGQTFYLSINSSGASDINTEKLKAREVSVDLSGASNATVFVTDKLQAGISGVGTINYYGSPKTIEKNISGLGSINQK